MVDVAYDYSFARPDPASLGEGALRYLAPTGWFSWPDHSAGKIVGLDEIATLEDAGKAYGLVWEIDTNDYLGGYDGGLAAGQRARTMARQLGFPDDLPIYCAVDRPISNATAVDYQRGFADGAGRARPYGAGALIEACVAAGFTDAGWMPETWGHSDHLALEQLVYQRDGVEFVDGTDANVIHRDDWGGHLPGSPAPAPTPGSSTPQEDLTWLYPML